MYLVWFFLLINLLYTWFIFRDKFHEWFISKCVFSLIYLYIYIYIFFSFTYFSHAWFPRDVSISTLFCFKTRFIHFHNSLFFSPPKLFIKHFFSSFSRIWHVVLFSVVIFFNVVTDRLTVYRFVSRVHKITHLTINMWGKCIYASSNKWVDSRCLTESTH